MATTTYTKAGTKAPTPVKLSKDIFGLEVTNHELIKQAYLTYLSNGRENLAVTKTRGLVRGGGKKPWKQKGTGRARFGSSRVPIWRGGGITFGPTGEENYTKNLNVKAKRLAIKQALSLADQDSKIIIIEEINPKITKTAELSKLLTKVGANKKTLVVMDKVSDELFRASGNLKEISILSAKYLNVYDVLNANAIIISKPALDVINDWLSPKKAKV